VMPAFVPGWDEISCRSRCLHRRAFARWLICSLWPLYAAPCRS
jgi:hypothetical protein